MSGMQKWNENEAILHSLQDDIIVTNVEGIIVKTSEKTGEIYGTDPDKLIGKSVYTLEKEGLFTPIATPMVVKERKRITFVQSTKEGKKLLVTGIPVFNEHGDLVRIVSYSHDITDLMEVEKYLMSMQEEMERVKSELDLLRKQHFYTEGIIARSSEMKKVIQTALQVSSVNVNVLLLGETGVGKSLIAKFIHNKSPRSDGPFIEVNCGAIPENLFEAEFFGYESASFTGANPKGKMGLAELAKGGTLFLDEVGELPLNHQVKILKFIQEKQFYRVGGTKPRKVDFRLIAATNKNLGKAVIEKTFREDLFFRLNVVPITIPPLRERTEDLLPLIDYLLRHFEKEYGRSRRLDEAAIQHLLHYEWKGNVRELVNMIERLVVTSPSTLITCDDLPKNSKGPFVPSFYESENKSLSQILESVEKKVLLKSKQRYKTTTRIAEALQISQPSVVRKLKKYNIQ